MLWQQTGDRGRGWRRVWWVGLYSFDLLKSSDRCVQICILDMTATAQWLFTAFPFEGLGELEIEIFNSYDRTGDRWYISYGQAGWVETLYSDGLCQRGEADVSEEVDPF